MNKWPYIFDCVIVDGHPQTKDDTNVLADLAELEQKVILDFIKANIKSRKSPNWSHTSYGIKQLITRLTGVYITDNQMKDAMLMCGFKPVEEHWFRWVFRISERSPLWKIAYERRIKL